MLRLRVWLLLLCVCGVAPRLFANAADATVQATSCQVPLRANESAQRRVDQYVACRSDVVSGVALDEAYADGACDPATHPLPRFEARDFLAPCVFDGDVKRVFFVVAHTALALVTRLVDRLSGPGNQIVLHVDDHEDPATIATLLALVAGKPNRCLVRSLNIVYLTASVRAAARACPSITCC